MIIDKINEMRKTYGRRLIQYVDNEMSIHCEKHCWAMAQSDRIYISPEYFRNGWLEASAAVTFDGRWEKCEEELLKMVLMEEHGREIVLDATVVAFAVLDRDGLCYLTLRGK